jgi:hypothetical protein
MVRLIFEQHSQLLFSGGLVSPNKHLRPLYQELQLRRLSFECFMWTPGPNFQDEELSSECDTAISLDVPQNSMIVRRVVGTALKSGPYMMADLRQARAECCCRFPRKYTLQGLDFGGQK